MCGGIVGDRFRRMEGRGAGGRAGGGCPPEKGGKDLVRGVRDFSVFCCEKMPTTFGCDQHTK